MVNAKKSNTLRKNKINELQTVSLQSPDYSRKSSTENIFQAEKRMGENLQDSYDRLMNNDIKIASHLMVSSVSNHLERVARQRTNQEEVNSSPL